jgi:hypothetical protein
MAARCAGLEKEKGGAFAAALLSIHPAVVSGLVVLRQQGGRLLPSVVQSTRQQLQIRWATVAFSLVESK